MQRLSRFSEHQQIGLEEKSDLNLIHSLFFHFIFLISLSVSVHYRLWTWHECILDFSAVCNERSLSSVGFTNISVPEFIFKVFKFKATLLMWSDRAGLFSSACVFGFLLSPVSWIKVQHLGSFTFQLQEESDSVNMEKEIYLRNEFQCVIQEVQHEQSWSCAH